MAHNITALLGHPQSLGRLAMECALPGPVVLNEAVAAIPLGHAQLDLLSGPLEPSTDENGFCYLGPELTRTLCRLSEGGAIGYVETDYFGGTGCQGAAYFEAGKLIFAEFEPIGAERKGNGPINRALASLGVKLGWFSKQDEFDSVGLGRFRSLEAMGLTEDN